MTRNNTINNNNTTTTQIEETPVPDTLLHELNQIQRITPHDDFLHRELLTRNNIREATPTTSTTPTSTTSTTTTTTSTSTPTVSEDPLISEMPRRRLTLEERLHIIDNYTNTRIRTSDIPNLPSRNIETPRNVNTPTAQENQEPELEPIENLTEQLEQLRLNAQNRIVDQQAAVDVYAEIAQRVAVLRTNVNNMFIEIARFAWFHPYITGGSIIAFGGTIWMLLRGRNALSIIRTLTATSPLQTGLAGLIVANNNNQDVITTMQRNNISGVIIGISQTGGILYMLNFVLRGLRR